MAKQDIRKSFAAVVRSRRKELGMSQEQLAEAARLHRTYIGGIERGERNVSLINVAKIARALNLKLDEMFRRMG